MAVTVGLPATVTEFGVNGQAIAGVDAGFATQVTPFNPTLLIIEIGINDSTLVTASGTFTASYTSVVNKALALNPQMKFLLINGMVNGELWAAGPVFSGNSTDSDTARINALIASQVTTLKGMGLQAELVDVRAGILKEIVARNSPAPGILNGRATLDGVHPTTETCLMMGYLAFNQLNFVATGSERIHIVGDSITNTAGPNGGWHLKPTGFKDMIKRQVVARSRIAA